MTICTRLASFASFRLVAAYLRQVPAEDLLQALGFHEEELGANTWFVLPNDDGVFEGSTIVEEQVCVSAVQAYLDLLAMPERAKEAAAHLRAKCLAWR